MINPEDFCRIESADRGRVRAESMVKGTDKIIAVLLAEVQNPALLEYNIPEVENIILICKKHIDDISYIFKLELTEEQRKEDPKVTVQPADRGLKINTVEYMFHITPEMTQHILPGKYWYSIHFRKNGQDIQFKANILTIEPNIIDSPGGQFVNSEVLPNLDEYEF